jgi:hypothetical protein
MLQVFIYFFLHFGDARINIQTTIKTVVAQFHFSVVAYSSVVLPF